MGEYHCLISGLPDINVGDKGKGINLKLFTLELKEILSNQDYELVRLFLLKIDNKNLIQFIDNPEDDFLQEGNYSKDDIAEIILKIKEDEDVISSGVPEYFVNYIISSQTDQPVNSGALKEDQLNAMYYNYALNCKNEFVRNWFEFNMNLYNVLTAITCRKHNLEIKDYLVGDNEISITIKGNSSRDFGITGMFDFLEPVIRLADERSIFDREKKIDALRWQYLDEQVFFHYFTVERIFAYMIMVETIERWTKLTAERGEQIFREFIVQLQNSFEFPSMFILNK